MQEACQARLAEAGHVQYEVSAYAQAGRRCAHNLNYWQFGDYLGIGAGAHAKITGDDTIRRRWKARHPRRYLEAANHPERIGEDREIPVSERAFEYMLNALRLIEGTPLHHFPERSGLPMSHITGPIGEAIRRGWLQSSDEILRTTPLGQRFLNDVITLFM
jgi:oxygen-independent coproporphyrinogen-3 oxidase